jgi:hypothetical protein
MAAVAAAKEGASVVLLEPGNHVGGMLSGGLGRTDMDRQENIIGGLALEFFRRAGRTTVRRSRGCSSRMSQRKSSRKCSPNKKCR